MNVPAWLWIGTVVGVCAVIVVDLVVVDRRPREFTSKDAVRWVILYVVLAALFAVFLFFWAGGTYAGQFVAGYLTEYSLSVDNLFVFMVLMAWVQVPKELQHRVLLIGVVIALVLRAALIVIGAEALHRFAVTFFLFAGFLIFTAWKVWRSHDATPDPEGNALVRWISRHMPMTRDYHGTHLMIKLEGQRTYTPLILVMIAIGTTDLLFAVDSIPAVFGLTQEAYIVFAANAFALMGLRQLYFLLRGLISKLIYLNRGLAFILLFIGLKMVLEAINATFHTYLWQVPTWLSLVVIVGALTVTAVTSLVAVKRNPALAMDIDNVE